MRITSFLAAGLLGTAITAAAVAGGADWGVTRSPAKMSDGTDYCMLWYRDKMPMMNFTAIKGKQLVVVVTPELAAAKPRAQGRLSFSSGREYEMAFLNHERVPGEPSGNSLIADEDVGTIMADIAIGGELTVHVGASVRLTFPLDGAASESLAFKRCREKLRSK